MKNYQNNLKTLNKFLKENLINGIAQTLSKKNGYRLFKANNIDFIKLHLIMLLRLVEFSLA